MDPDIFIAFYPSFQKYAADLKGKKSRTDEETHILSCVNLLLSTIATDFRVTLSSIGRLVSHAEIEFDLLYSILVPRTIMVGRCAITGLPRLFQLVSWTRKIIEAKSVFQLDLESIDLVDRPITQSVVVGRVRTTLLIRYFSGTIKIDTMDVYPIQFHRDRKALEQTVCERAKKWVELIGMHHKQYEGIAAMKFGERVVKHNVRVHRKRLQTIFTESHKFQVRSRIMVDRSTFRRLNPNHTLPAPVPPQVDDNLGVPRDPRFGNEIAVDEWGTPIPQPPLPQLSGMPSHFFIFYTGLY